MLDTILLVAAVVFFLMCGFNVPKFNWMCFGFACLTATLIL